jgi:hypothetical protein
MDRVEPKKIIRNLYKKYAIVDGNLIDANKLFVINTIINYIFKDKDYKKIDTKQLANYGELINRFLKEEVDIYWKDDKLLVEELDAVGKQTSGE